MLQIIKKLYYPLKRSLLKRISHHIARVSSQPPPNLLEIILLSLAWGNLGYSAGIGYLRHIVALVRSTQGPILECGSGGTTLLMACLTDPQQREIWVLEHHRGWFKYIQEVMQVIGFDHVKLLHAPLESHGEYDWYTLSNRFAEDSAPFSLVICDGPPGSTRGGRFGLVPVMGDRLDSNCIVLLDDTHRQQEKHIIEAWGEIRTLEIRTPGLLRTYTEVAFST